MGWDGMGRKGRDGKEKEGKKRQKEEGRKDERMNRNAIKLRSMEGREE